MRAVPISETFDGPWRLCSNIKGRLIGLLAGGFAALSLLAGCTTFGRISWRNALIVLRTPDAVPDRITSPARPEARLAALWVGHSTVLVQMDDKFILTDPVFTRFAGGVSPRLVQPGLAPEHVPPLDAVLVSHRHFDHLSKGSFPLIQQRTTTVLTPPDTANDVPKGHYTVTELSAWQVWEKNGMRITAVPVAHSGGRLMGDNDSHAKSFTGFVIEYRGMVVFFPGDTAYDEPVFRAIAAKFPSVDLALMPIGPIKPEPEMSLHHLTPAQALAASRILGAMHMLPIHFATFINSLDRPGEVEAIFERTMSMRLPTSSSAALLPIGGQRVFRLR